jgi:GNAT superfamily N-acetyltransferase
MNGDASVRRYEPRDRAAVREICCDTADAGEPVERFFPDREVFADFLTRYYTDIAPESSWVVEQGGQVMGYLLGCLDSEHFARAMVWRIGPPATFRAIGRGLLWNRQIWRLWRANTGGDKVAFNRSQVHSEYPAHLHINLRRNFRGQGVGRVLMERFMEQAIQAKVAGVHAGVADANPGGKAFFEKLGFIALGRERRLRMPDRPNIPAFTIIYGKRLAAGKLS